MPVAFQRGDLLLATLVFSNQTGAKRRPVLVLHDYGDNDLLVIPITSQGARSDYDVPLSDWRGAGLRLPSVARTNKPATLEKGVVDQHLGRITDFDWTAVEATLQKVFKEIVP